MTSVLTGRTSARREHRRPRDGHVPARTPARRLAAEQLAVAGGQLGAGAGNLLFTLAAARALAPEAFAELAAFLALYLTVHVPAGSLSAGSALAPELAARARKRVLAIGLAAGGALAVLAFPLASLLELSPALLLAAAASAPTAGLIALDRGRLYGLRLLPRAVGSLLAEPAVRLTFGVTLALVVGPVGAAAAVVLAGWAALAVAQLPPRAAMPGAAEGRFRRAGSSRGASGPSRPGANGGSGPLAASRPASSGRSVPLASSRPAAGSTIVAFLLLALVQNQDVLLANALLPGAEAARFAVLSTIGGAAAFATTTVPLMLLGRRDDERALRVALGVAAALGAGAVGVIAIAPGALIGAAFGDRYEDAGAVAVPYLLAMALLGVARVLVAHACVTRPPARVLWLLAGAAALQTGLLVLLADDAAGMVTATLVATAVLTAGAGTVALPRAQVLAPARHRDFAIVAALTLAGIGVRLASSRGIWLDEATSVWQAQMSLGDLLTNLRTNDVHPPLHHLVLWVTVRLLGTGELAVRLPSLLAAAALIPLLYAAGRDLYDRRAGLAAAVLGTVAPFTVWYAQEARMYALFMLFALISVWMQARVLRDGRRRDWAALTLSAAALVATQYFGLLLVAVQQLAFLVAFRARRRDLARLRALGLPWLAFGAVLALILAPVLAFGRDQFAANEAAGKGFQQVPSQTGGALDDSAAPPGPYAALTNVVWALFGYHSDATMTRLVALWPLLMLLLLGLLGRGRSSRTALIVASAAVPALALFGLGQLKPFVFEVRYFIGVVPLALLLAGRAATSWSPRPATQVAAVGAAAALLAGGLADQQLNGDNPRVYDFRGALQDVADRARPGDVLVYSPQYLGPVVDYYAEGVEARPLDRGLPKPKRGRRVILLGSFLDKPQYRRATAEAVRSLERRHERAADRRYPQIRVWEFTR